MKTFTFTKNTFICIVLGFLYVHTACKKDDDVSSAKLIGKWQLTHFEYSSAYEYGSSGLHWYEDTTTIKGADNLMNLYYYFNGYVHVSEGLNYELVTRRSNQEYYYSVILEVSKNDTFSIKEYYRNYSNNSIIRGELKSNWYASDAASDEFILNHKGTWQSPRARPLFGNLDYTVTFPFENESKLMLIKGNYVFNGYMGPYIHYSYCFKKIED